MRSYKQNSLANIQFFLYLSSDHLTPATGKTPTAQISKNGGALVAYSGLIVELGSGLYSLQCASGTTDTVGDLAFIITAAGCDDVRFIVQITVVTVDELVRSTTPGNKLDVSATGEAGLDFTNLKNPASGAEPNIHININGANYVTDVVHNVFVQTNLDKVGYTLSAAGIQAVWDALLANLVTPDTIGQKLATLTPGGGGATAVEIRQEMDNNSVQLAKLDANISTRSTLTPGDVLTQVNTALDAVDGELASVPASPSTSVSFRDRIKFLYQYFRFKRNTTVSTETMLKANGNTPLATSPVSDDGTTASHGPTVGV